MLDADPQRSASHANAIACLTTPFAGGAVETPLTLATSNGTVVTSVDWMTREPLLLVGTAAAVDSVGFSVTVTVTPRATAAMPTPSPPTTIVLRVAPFTEAGAFLPAWPLSALADPAQVAPFDVTLQVAGAVDGGASLLDVRVVEGVLGRLIYVMGVEKQRLRRQARELAALRGLEFVFDPSNPDHVRMGGALDRWGAELGVPRFADRLTWDPTEQQPTTVNVAEPDESYRQRLMIYRPFLMANRKTVVAALNTLPTPTAASFTVDEANCEFAVALQLFSSPDDQLRLAFLAWLRANRLLQPGQPIPTTRMLPSVERTELQATMTRLGTSFAFPAGAFIAPLLAEALDRVGLCRAALGVGRPLSVLRAQDDAGGSRYELGLGVDLEIPPAAELDQLATALTSGQLAAGTDIETKVLLNSLTSAPSSADPLGRWLLAGCGLKTVHQPAADRCYVSHFPFFGAVLNSTTGNPLGLEAHLHAPRDPGPDAVLWYALNDAVTAAATQNLPAWTQVGVTPPPVPAVPVPVPVIVVPRPPRPSPVALTEPLAIASAVSLGSAVVPSASALAAFQSVGLRTPADQGALTATTAALGAMPPEQFAVLSLDATMAAGVLANDAQAVGQLGSTVAILKTQEIVSALPLVGPGSALWLVVAVAPLPGGTMLNSRRLQFRWYSFPIEGLPGALSAATGPRTQYSLPTVPGLSAVVAVTLARSDQEDPRGRVEPYQARINLPDGALMDLPSFEWLMNYLERAVPIGVVVDTEAIRTSHVDPTGEAQAAFPLTGRLTHSFRTFRQPKRLATNP